MSEAGRSTSRRAAGSRVSVSAGPAVSQGEVMAGSEPESGPSAVDDRAGARSGAEGEGADEVVDAIEQHGQWLADSGRLDARRAKRAADEVEAIALTALRPSGTAVIDGKT